MKIITGIIICCLVLIYFLENRNEPTEPIKLEGLKNSKFIPSQTKHIETDSENHVEIEKNKGGRVIFPYREKLPPNPNKEDVLHGFPDVNENGVRDDIEIGVVEDFQDDAQLVEHFFSSARFAQADLELSVNNLLTKENLQKSMEQVDLTAACGHYYFDYFYGAESVWEWIDVYNLHIHSKTYNTDERRSRLDELEVASHGLPGGFTKITHQQCQGFSNSSKNLFNQNQQPR